MKNKTLSSAIALLARREHGAYELAQKLLQKGYPQEEIHEALENCQRMGLQSDERFSESVCRARIRQGYGPIRICQELQGKKIAVEIIEGSLAHEQENWLAYATEVKRKKYKSESQSNYAALQKQKQFLYYRGFSMDTIEQVFKESP